MTTLSAHIRQSASRHADSAVIEYHGSSIKYLELTLIADYIAKVLDQTYNVRPNDTVAIVSENTPVFLCVCVALWNLGAVVAPLNPTAPTDLLSNMLDLTEARLLFVSSSTHDGTIRAISASNGSKTSRCISFGQLLGCPNERDPSIEHLKSLTTSATCAIVSSITDPDLPCINLFTSSAVSKDSLKCVPITHRTIIFDNMNTADFLQILDKPQRELAWAPLFHYMGLCIGFLGHVIATGGCYVFGVPSLGDASSGLSIPEELIRTITRLQHSELGITIMSAVPWIIEVWQQDPKVCPIIRTLHSLLVSGAALNEDQLLWAKKNKINLINALGMSETGALFYSARAPELFTETITGYSVLPQKFAHLIDDDLEDEEVHDLMKHPQNCKPSQRGEMLISSRYIFRGYRSKSSRDVYHNAETGISTFRTRDMYECIADGTYKYIGRADDVVQLSNGEKVNVIPFESLLNQCTGVLRSCVSGNNGPRLSDHLLAFIEVDSDDPTSTAWSAIKQINSRFSPAARISFDRLRVFDAKKDEHIPITRKQTVFRKLIWQDFLPTQAKPVPKSMVTPLSRKTFLKDKIHLCVEQIICQVFHVVNLQQDDTFESLGLTSIIASRIVDHVKKELGVELEAAAPFIYPTVESLSQRIRSVEQPVKISQFDVSYSHTPQDAVVFVSGACRFPGGITCPQEYWEALMGNWGKECITSIPLQRWSNAALKAASGQSLKASKVGWLEDIDYLDNTFFNVSNAEATYLNPNTRLALECTWEALENANVRPSSLRGRRVGVYMGVSSSCGFREVCLMNRGFGGYDQTFESGVSEASLSGRISHFLDVRGPSLTIQTACSSSLVAVQNGLQAIRNGECEIAIVGGVTTHLWPGAFMYLSQAGLISARGKSAAFSDDADGFAPSEGACVMVMMKASEARKKNLPILGIAKDAVVMHNGYTPGLAAPSASGQAELLSTSLAKSGVSSASIGLHEAHGTGTIVGDQIEIEAINRVYGGSSRTNSLLLGSSKTVIGHTEEAAGAAGVLKVLLSLQHSILPPHPFSVSKKLNLNNVPLQINSKAKNIATVEYASVSSFGFSGTIANAIIQRDSLSVNEIANSNGNGALHRTSRSILTISARSQEALVSLIKAYGKASQESASWANFCYTSNVARDHFKYRAAVVSETQHDCFEKLKNFGVGSVSPSQGFSLRIKCLAEYDVNLVQHSLYDATYRELLEFSPDNELWIVFSHLAATFNVLMCVGLRPGPIYSEGKGTILAAYLCGALRLSAAYALLHMQEEEATAAADYTTFEKWEAEHREGIASCGDGFHSTVTGRMMTPKTRLGATFWHRHFNTPPKSLDIDATDIGIPIEELIVKGYLNGGSVDWDVYHEKAGHKVAIPNYKFDRKRFWPDPQPGSIDQLLVGMGMQK